MKVLLTGATGFLGRHIIRKLVSEGTDVVALVRKTSETSHLTDKHLTFIEGNLRDRDSIRKAMKNIDVIVHAATCKGGPWPEFYADNVQSTEWLLDEAVKHRIRRFIFISSVAVYDHSKMKNGSHVNEDSPREKVYSTHYSRSKVEAERLVEKAHNEQGVPTVVIRPACIYGTGGYWYPSRLGFSAGKNYAILGNGKSVVPLSHTDSVSDLIWLTMNRDEAAGQSYNVVEDEPVTRSEYLKMAREILYPGMKTIRIPLWLARFMAWGLRSGMRLAGMNPPTRLNPMSLRLFAKSIFYDAGKAGKELGWKPRPEVRQTIREILEWHKEQHKPVSGLFTPSWPVVISGQKKIRTVIAGAGTFSKTHLDILRSIEQAEVTAICDPDLNAAEALAGKYNIPHAFASLDEILKSSPPDVVHVVSPAQTHKALSILAMNAGCHVLVEKPMAVNAREAREMIRTSEKQGRLLCVEHTYLYDPMMIQARRIINEGVLGKLIQFESWFGTSYSSNRMSPYLAHEARNHWVYQLPGLLFQNFISHPLSVILELFPDIVPVSTVTSYNRIVPHMKSDEMRTLFKSGSVIGTLSLSMGVTPRYNFINIYGTEAALLIDFSNQTVFLDKGNSALPKVIGRNLTLRKRGAIYRKAGMNNLKRAVTGKDMFFQGNEILIRLFYRSLCEGAPLPVPVENGLRSMEVMDAIWKQAEI